MTASEFQYLPIGLAIIVLVVCFFYSRKATSMHPVDWFGAAYNANLKTIPKATKMTKMPKFARELSQRAVVGSPSIRQ